AHLAQTRVLDDALVEQRFDGVELFAARHLRVDAVQLPQPDLLDAELLAASLRLGPEMVGTAIHLPGAGARAREPGFGGNEKAVIRIERLADQLLGDIGAIGIGGVDEIDAEFGHALKRSERFGAILRRTPHARSGDAHRAEAEAMHLDVAANREGAGSAGI